MALSRSAVDKLGGRLRAGNTTDADWSLLEDLRAERQRHLAVVIERIRTELGLDVTGRVKTTGTLVDKLQRERMRFSQMDDLAGARIKVDGTRLDQDAVVGRLRELWPDARVKDRRAQPVHGYRAVHLIPTVEGWPLEVQVRTKWQDAVANLLESLADRWGRQIRYGGIPDDPDVPGHSNLSRLAYVGKIQELADLTADVELVMVASREGIDPAVLRELELRIDGFAEALGISLEQ